jgi:hypothetical protein
VNFVFNRQLGFVRHPAMKIGSGCTTHLRENEPPEGRLVVAVSKHYTAVIDRVIHDTYNPDRDGIRCVYGYWQMEKSCDSHDICHCH